MRVEVTWTEQKNRTKTQEFYLVAEDEEEYFISLGFFTQAQFDRLKREGFVILKGTDLDENCPISLSFLHSNLISYMRVI